MEKIEKKYTIKNFVIDRNNINDFEIMKDRRMIRKFHVSKINGVLLSGKNPVGVLTVNNRFGKYRIIDGNHRVEAIKNFYSYKKANEDIKIECVLKVFEGLSDDEERNIYTNEATRRNESYEDRLNIYKNTIRMWKLLADPINTFPCNISIYSQKKSLRFRVILDALYINNISTDGGFSPGSLRMDDLVPFALERKFIDYQNMREFINFFIEVFGEIETDNVFVKNHVFIPLFDIYMRNRKIQSIKTVKNRFSKLIGRNELMSAMMVSGREGKMRIRELMIAYVNIGHSKNKFV